MQEFEVLEKQRMLVDLNASKKAKTKITRAIKKLDYLSGRIDLMDGGRFYSDEYFKKWCLHDDPVIYGRIKSID